MTSNASLKLNTVLPPVETYGGVGNPYETSLKHRMNSVNAQNELNKIHGGSLRVPNDGSLRVPNDGSLRVPNDGSLRVPNGGSLRVPIRERRQKRVHWGGATIRPAEITVPQAPTFGMPQHGPNNGNTLATNASKTLLAGVSNAQYDSDVKVPPLPSQSPQSGGSLLQRLERLIANSGKKSKSKSKSKSKKSKSKKSKSKKSKSKKTVKKEKKEKKGKSRRNKTQKKK